MYEYPHPYLGDKFPLRVFYKSDGGDRVTVHAVSIPLKLLEVIVCRHQGGHHDGDLE